MSENLPEHEFESVIEWFRYGKLSYESWFSDSMSYVSIATQPHGTMLYNNGKCELLECLTWVDEVTYILKNCDLKGNESRDIGQGRYTAIVRYKVYVF